MNKILEIDKDNMVCVSEAGVTTSVLQDAVQKEGLFYGGDPCSGDSCSIGANYYAYMPPLFTASAIYLAETLLISKLAKKLERKLAESD